MQLHHISRCTFSALAVWILSTFVRIAHWVSIGWVPGEPHLELLAEAVGMGRGSRQGRGQSEWAETIATIFFFFLKKLRIILILDDILWFAYSLSHNRNNWELRQRNKIYSMVGCPCRPPLPGVLGVARQGPIQTVEQSKRRTLSSHAPLVRWET